GRAAGARSGPSRRPSARGAGASAALRGDKHGPPITQTTCLVSIRPKRIDTSPQREQGSDLWPLLALRAGQTHFPRRASLPIFCRILSTFRQLGSIGEFG